MVGRSSIVRAMAHEIYKLFWMRGLLQELGFSSQGPMSLYCDNMTAISIGNNHVQHDRTKNIEVHKNFIKEKLNQNKYVFLL